MAKKQGPEVLTRDGIKDDEIRMSCHGRTTWAEWCRLEAAFLNTRPGRDVKVERREGHLALIEYGTLPNPLTDDDKNIYLGNVR